MTVRSPSLLFLVLPLVACLEPTSGVVAQELCERWTAVACASRANPPGCEAHHSSFCEGDVAPFLRAQVAAGAASWDQAAADACLDALVAEPSSVGPASCEAAVLGSKALGAACGMTEECGEDAWCDRSAGCPGVCTTRSTRGDPAPPFELPGEGEACGPIGGLSMGCAAGLFCDEGICATPPSVGEPCPAGVCAFGATCDSDRVCAAWPGHGEACLPSAGLGGGGLGGLGFGLCRFGWCDGASDSDPGTCTAFRDHGAPCSSNVECGYGRCIEGRCGVRPDICGDGFWRVIPNPLVVETSGAVPAPAPAP